MNKNYRTLQVVTREYNAIFEVLVKEAIQY
jgi:hypothetical protein